MTEVRYYCPRCEAVAALDREGYLADKCVTPYPLKGWEYAHAYEDFEGADGVEIVCGAGETDGEGCGEVYYLSFVRFEDGEEVEPRPLGDVLPSGPTVAGSGKSDGGDDDDDGPRFDFKP
jgi:hypothetical protein